MGAPPPGRGTADGDRLDDSLDDWLDVERWRAVTRRTLAVRRPPVRSVVLGSSQPADVIDAARAASAGAAVHRRRSGGGAVMVDPAGTLWVDAWVPTGDPLADSDVLRASWWVGEWWSGALASMGVAGTSVERGRATRDALSKLVCFAGHGPGEVMVGSRKVVGVAQWRCRQGALLQSVAHGAWDPAALLDLLVVPPALEPAVARVLPGAGAGISDLRPGTSVPALETALFDALPPGRWEVERAG